MACHTIESVFCTSVQKRTYPHKHYVYCLNVSWSDGEENAIYRKYSSFFDFQAQLKEELRSRVEVTVPELPALRLFERENRVGKDTAEKRKKKIEDFCKQTLNLPPEIIWKPSVMAFFEPWPTDVLRHVKQGEPEGQPRGLASKLFKLFEDNRIQKKLTSLAKGVTERQQHKRSSSASNIVDASSMWHVDPEATPATPPTSQPLARRNKDCDRSGENGAEDTQYRVLCSYEKRQSNEISLEEGERVDVIDKLISGWWLVSFAENGGGAVKQGWAPGSYLEPIGKVAAADFTKPNEGATFKTLCDYTAQDDDEVSYTKGQELTILQTNMDGWWLVQVNGQMGFTPAANLEQPGQEDEEEDALYAYIRTSLRESQVFRKAPPPRCSSSLRWSKAIAAMRYSDTADYAEIGDPTSAGVAKGPIKGGTGKPLDEPGYASIGDFTNTSEGKEPVNKNSGDDTSSGDVNLLYAQVDLTKKKNRRPQESAPPSGQYVNCEVFPNGKVTQLQRPAGEELHVRNGKYHAEEKDQRTHPGLNYVSVEVGSNESPTDSAHPEVKRITPVEYADIIPITLPKLPREMRKTSDDGKEPERPSRPAEGNKSSGDRAQPWYFGHISRNEAEEVLKKHAKQNQFLVRESASKGDFSISVLHDGRVRHFRIEQTADGQYHIGNHNFTRVKDIVKTYQRQPLFIDSSGVSVLLTDPVKNPSGML